MLVDDDPDDNFFHERVIKKSDAANTVIAKQTGMAALEYLTSKSDHSDTHPDLIFLDINMPGMNGWEFLIEYNQLDRALQGYAIVMMLTTSQNPDDKAKAEVSGNISEYITKPLTKEILKDIVDKYFKQQEHLRVSL